MGRLKLKGKDLRKIGFKEGKPIGIALEVMLTHYSHLPKHDALELLSSILDDPERYKQDAILKTLSDSLIPQPKENWNEITLRPESRKYNIFGQEYIEEGAINQMNIAIRLPVAVSGALMPDAHQGYGLPIGGVLATENAVIPYGVGVDIGCRMCLSIFDLPESYLERNKKELVKAIKDNTLFGAGKEFSNPMDDEVLERNEFQMLPLLRSLHEKAVKQIGTSGSGNHFVEFGSVELIDENEFNIPPGKYLGLLSHSGSRGLGANIANYYTKLAMEKCRLPKEARHLAWLDLSSEEGQEYWLAMNLAGDYASACHHQIHKKITKGLGAGILAMVENHHNYAWKELIDGKEVIVHRKGATPAGKGVLGIIPGSMSAPGFIVKGKGETSSINSASHGAGRKMSRSQALKTFTDKEVHNILKSNGITLIGGGLDEAPMVYKDIEDVMKSQKGLVDIIGKFYPKIVRMDS
jgi:tRNA-splicing ligase RtcB (3'-phosphate/5'-hydroxy nucleic acid ligase)